MPKKTYADGDVVYAPLVNKLNNMQFVETPNDDGQLPLITDTQLSNAPGSVKPTVQAIAGEFSILSTPGRTVSYQGGRYATSTLVATIPNGSIVLPANATTWLFVNDSNPNAPVVATSATLPTSGMVFGRFVTDANAVTSSVSLYARARGIPTGAPLNSPKFTGIPTAPTQPLNDNNTDIATTAFVQALRRQAIVKARRTTSWVPSGGFQREIYYTVPFDAIDQGTALNTSGILTCPSLSPFTSRDFHVITRLRLIAGDLARPNINAKLSLFVNAVEVAVLSESVGRGVLVLGGSDIVPLSAGDLLTVRIYINPTHGDPDSSLVSQLSVSGSSSSKLVVEL